MTSATTSVRFGQTNSHFLPAQQELETLPPTANSQVDRFDEANISSIDNAQPSTHKGLVTELCEFGKQLAAQPRSVGTSFTVGPGVALGLRLEGSVHSKSSSVVKENPFRLASHMVLENSNPYHTVVWSQVGGVTELGVGLNCTLPLSQFASLQFGFSPSTLLRYRCTLPHVLGFFQTQGSALKRNGSVFPFSSSAAKNLVAGTECEISGQGRVNLSASLSANCGSPSGTPISFGVGGSLFAEDTKTRDLALNVLSLDGRNHVRVTLRETKGENSVAGARAYLGFSSQLSSALPKTGEGLLQKAASWLTGSILDSLVSYFAMFSLQAAAADGNKDAVIATFDFDLSDSKACEAYNSLMTLSATKANELSRIPGAGVKKFFQAEKEHSETDEISASLFGDKLFLYQALENEKRGHFIRPDGETTLYRQAHVKKRESGWFDPTRDVLWETVSLKDIATKKVKSYFHFRYEKSGSLNEQDYDDFFKLGQCLSLPQNAGLEDSESRRLICQSSEANLTTDLYFTHDGICAIAETSKVKATNTFLDLAGKLRPSLALSSLQARSRLWMQVEPLLDKYANELRAGWFLNFGYFDRIAKWESEYQALCGRSLDRDALTYLNAKGFAERIAQLQDVNDADGWEKFFVSLGEAKGFAYQISIAALATLAGDKETLVHQHELKGNGLVFKYADEGRFEEPSEIVKSILSKML